MFGYPLESNGFTHGKCIWLYTRYSSSKRLNNYNKSSAIIIIIIIIINAEIKVTLSQ